MAWAEIYKKEYHADAVEWSVFLNSYTREMFHETQAIISKIKPYLDLIEPTMENHRLKWYFSEEEYKAMMGDGDEDKRQ